MRAPAVVVALGLVFAPALAHAQGEGQRQPAGFIEGLGGATFNSSATSDAFGGSLGIRVAPHVFITADFGRMKNEQFSTFQNTLAQTVQAASATDIALTPVSSDPLWFGSGGLRVETNPLGRVTPFVTGSFGMARLTPSAMLTFNGGTGQGQLAMVPTVGADITSQIVALGLYTAPASETHPMMGLGGGVSIALASRLSLDLAYRYSRVFATTPLNVSGLNVGIGYRF